MPSMDVDTARHLYAQSGRAVIATPAHTLADPKGELPDVVLSEGPPAIFHMPSSLLPPVEYLDDDEADAFAAGALHRWENRSTLR